MEKWYALHTKYHAEFRVAKALQEREFEVFLPEISVASRGAAQGAAQKAAQRVPQEVTRESFFPCYLFAKLDLLTMSHSVWQWTPGLRGIVAFGGEPIAIPDQAIEAIKKQADQWSKQRIAPSQPFRQGEAVRIMEGPFEDMVAIFNGPSTPGKRVQVLLQFLGQLKRVWLDADLIERTSAAASRPDHKQPRRTRGRKRYIHYKGLK
jgi:transcription antitermination factor NusG